MTEHATTPSPTSHLGHEPIRRIGFGAMQLAGRGAFGPPSNVDAARSVLRRAVELGVDHIDTAQFYGPQVVNELIRETLHPYPADLKLVTKIGAVRDEYGGWIPALRPADLRRAVEENLRTLAVEQLALVNLRAMGDGHALSEVTDEQLGAMSDLRDEGKIDQIGVSHVTTAAARRARELVGITAVQNPFSIIDRADQATLDFCHREGVAYVPYFPLGSAFTGGLQRLLADPALGTVAGRHGATVAQVALAWLLAHDERILLIPGTSSIRHLEENLAAGELTLTDDDLSVLGSVEQTPLDAP